MKKTIILIFFLLLALSGFSQESLVKINHEGKDFTMLKHAWKAQWITHPYESTLDYGVFLFRNSFDLRSIPEHFIIYLSADNRYRLYVNGTYITSGPSIGDINNYRYETIDISSFLKNGKNVIALEVVNYGEYRRAAQQTFQTAFILQSESIELPGLDINTGSGTWKVFKNNAYQQIPFTTDSLRAYYAAGPGERIDALKYPWGWEGLNFNDTEWEKPKAATVEFAVGRGFLYGSTWFLVPRQIPLMTETTERFNNIARQENIEGLQAFIEENRSARIPPGSKISILLDNKTHTTGFPVLLISKGKNAKIKITYAESLFATTETQKNASFGHFYGHDLKGNRNEVEGKEIFGYYDIIIADGGSHRRFKPLSRKTFRFIQLDIETQDQELILEDYYNVYTVYPFEEKATFKSDDDRLSEIWEVAWRTLMNSSEENFYDPYYEQLQYIGDTRIEALVSIYVSGDDRLMRKAIEQFDNSRLPNGLTQSRYPSYIVQIIPTYSLIWIGMIHDYFMYRDDEIFVEQFIPGMKTVLDWFANKVDSSGMATGLEWWNFTDWSKGFPNGIPPGADDGYSANVNLQYVYALQSAVEIFEHFNLNDDAEKYSSIQRKIQESVMSACFNEERELIAETPNQDLYSQHTNIWAILTNTIPANRQKELMKQVLSDDSLIQSTIYFKFYLFRALQKVGMGDEYLNMMDPWIKMLAKGMTTFGEKDDVPRSECHGWSASPCFDFLHTVAGIYPNEPGFKSLTIEPNFGHLNELIVDFPHPAGMLKLTLKKSNNQVSGKIILPETIKGVFIWKDMKIELTEGENIIN